MEHVTEHVTSICEITFEVIYALEVSDTFIKHVDTSYLLCL